MAITTVVRGQAVFIEVVFFDEEGQLLMPIDATLLVTYRNLGVKVTETFDMSPTTNGFEAIWDSAPADPGKMEWFASSLDTPTAATQGEVVILANSANPQGIVVP